jgi:hypothetical protein
MRRAGHASSAAAQRYQHASEDRDRVVADALEKMVEASPIIAIAKEVRS